MKCGRHRNFNENNALEQAMFIFWEKGYAGTSLSDLTEAMGINKPSLYATFGNKESLFIKAMNHYTENYASPLFHPLTEKKKDLKSRLKSYLLGIIDAQYNPHCPKGCFVSLGINECNNSLIPEKARQVILEARDLGKKYLTTLFKEEQKNGTFPKKLDPKSTATMLFVFIHGAAAMARGGYKKNEIQNAIEIALLPF